MSSERELYDIMYVEKDDIVHYVLYGEFPKPRLVLTKDELIRYILLLENPSRIIYLQ